MATDYSQYINPIKQGDFRYTAMGDPEANYEKELAQRNGMIQQGLVSGAFTADQMDALLKQGDVTQDQLKGSGSGGESYWESVAKRNKSELERQTQQIEIDKKRGYDSTGRPLEKEWKGIANEDGSLMDAYKMKDWQNVNPDTGALNKFSQTAMRDPKQQSAWAELMNEQIGANTAASMDGAAQQGSNGLLAMQSELAQSGGLSGAARERMASQNMRQGLLAKQGIQRQGMMDKMNVSAQDEKSRMDQLGALQQMNNQQADINVKNQQFGKEVEKYNIGNSINEVTQKRVADGAKYSQAMQEWGAGRTADAQRNASSGGKK